MLVTLQDFRVEEDPKRCRSQDPRSSSLKELYLFIVVAMIIVFTLTSVLTRSEDGERVGQGRQNDRSSTEEE